MVKQLVDRWAGLSGNLISGCNIFIGLVNGLGEMQDNNDISQEQVLHLQMFRICS